MSLIFSVAALAGTLFQCSADTATFSVFAPDAAETANYRGNVLTLYSVEADGEIVPASARISQIFDDLPYSLYIEMKGDEAVVEFEISDVDMAAGTASATVTGAPPSGAATSVTGTCTLAPEGHE